MNSESSSKADFALKQLAIIEHRSQHINFHQDDLCLYNRDYQERRSRTESKRRKIKWIE
jgi:hypothetical protein